MDHALNRHVPRPCCVGSALTSATTLASGLPIYPRPLPPESWDPRGRHATSLITRARPHVARITPLHSFPSPSPAALVSRSHLTPWSPARPGLPLPLAALAVASSDPPPLNLHSPCLSHEPIRWHGAAVTCRWLALVVRTCCSGRLPWTWWRRGVLAASDGGAAMEAVQTVRDLIRLFLVSSILSHARVDMSRHLAAWLIIPLFVCVGTWSYLLLSALFAYWWFNNCLLFNFNVI